MPVPAPNHKSQEQMLQITDINYRQSVAHVDSPTQQLNPGKQKYFYLERVYNAEKHGEYSYKIEITYVL